MSETKSPKKIIRKLETKKNYSVSQIQKKKNYSVTQKDQKRQMYVSSLIKWWPVNFFFREI